MDTIQELKLILREGDVPFFTDEELNYYLEENNNDLKRTAYHCLLLKAEDTSLTISGLTAADSSAYFRRMASLYRPTNSGILKGVF